MGGRTSTLPDPYFYFVLFPLIPPNTHTKHMQKLTSHSRNSCHHKSYNHCGPPSNSTIRYWTLHYVIRPIKPQVNTGNRYIHDQPRCMFPVQLCKKPESEGLLVRLLLTEVPGVWAAQLQDGQEISAVPQSTEMYCFKSSLTCSSTL